MATVNLGKIKLKWRSTWSSGGNYTADDVVEYTDGSVTSSFIAVASSTNQTPSTGGTVNTTYWNLLAKGQATSPTTTQGDLIVRGASADQRLAIGTAGQALKVNSSANGLEYGTAAGMTLLYQHNSTGGSAVNSFTVDGYFDDSKYSHYKAYVYDHFTASSGASNEPSLRLNVGGSADTSSNYFWSLDHAYGSGHHNRGNGSGTTGQSSIAQMQGTWNTSSNNRQLQNFEIHFYSPTTTGLGAKYVHWITSMFAQGTGNSGYLVSGTGGGMLETAAAVTGFTMFSANSTTFTYKLSLYGFNK